MPSAITKFLSAVYKRIGTFAALRWWWQWAVLSVMTIILYAPVLNNTFLSDDHLVLKKVCLDKELNLNGFFRPLSDITLYANYMVAGFNPLIYYLTNLLLHAFNAMLLLQYCKQWRWSADVIQQRFYAVLAAILFLTYPFHNESIAWILGRASLLAGTFGFLALVAAVGPLKEPIKILVSAGCYFVALTGYESAFVVPAMLLAWLLANGSPGKKIMLWTGAMAIVLIIHFLLRSIFSGTVVGDYGSGFFQFSVTDIIMNMAKVTGRLFLPPIKNATVFAALAAMVIIAILSVVVVFRRRFLTNKPLKRFAISQVACLMLALLIPYLFSVSTNTSESDRFLYFPSFFLIVLLALVLVVCIRRSSVLTLAGAALVCYYIFFLTANNLNWRKASGAVSGLMEILAQSNDDGKTYVVNLPDEIDGAFVFRVGFYDALRIRGIDTAKVHLVNQVKMRDLEELANIEPDPTGNSIYIAPRVLISRSDAGSLRADAPNKHFIIQLYNKDRIVYWDKERWIVLRESDLPEKS